MTRRGRLIAVEGLDGVGKTTLCTALRECASMATPGAHLAVARQIVHQEARGDPLALQLFYAMSVRIAGQRALEVMSAGQDVVIDRYWLSTIAYAETRGSPAGLSEVERHVVPADVTLLLCLDESERRDRLLLRGMTAADRETLCPAFSASVRERMRGLGRRPVAGRLVEIEVTRMSTPDLVNAVRQLLS